MKKHAVKRAKTAVSKKKQDLYISIDFPREGEALIRNQYTIRVSTPAGYAPEIALNGGAWNECRPSVGFWWFDWSGIPPGSHTVEARLRAGKKLLKKVLRTCMRR